MDGATFQLNVFSNAASRDLGENFVAVAVRSFEKAFGVPADRDYPLTLYVDPNPHRDMWPAWIEYAQTRLEGLSLQTVSTTGMADGYLRSVRNGQADFLVQLEHDFVFKADRIDHRLDQLVGAMADTQAHYLRFNKRWNRVSGTDAVMRPVDHPTVPLCWSNSRSNNPHLVDRRAYQTYWLPFSQKMGGALLEGGVCRYLGGGLVYGDLGMPASVGHLDGRGVRLKDVLMRPLLLRFSA